MPSDRHAALPRKRIGNFELTGFVGEGGMGVIYKARDLALDRTVAVKVLREELRAQHDTVARFRREGQAAAILSHPNIVQIYAVGTEDNLPYIAMDYIKGRPLSMVMQQDGPIPWQRALHIAEQVARALACAHEAQVIHRDVKPGNILLDASDTAFVTDFGIAKILTTEEQLTVDGTRLGTPQYMAPERCRDGAATAAGDIYALGVLIFQMVSGRLPYEAATSVELVRKILSAPPYRLRHFVPKLPEPVERLVAYLIEKQPGDRPPSAEEAARLIASVRDGGSLEGVGNSLESALADFRQTGPPRLSWTDDPTTIFMPGGPLAQFTLHWFGTPKPWLVIVSGVLLLLLGIGAGMLTGKALEPHPLVLAKRTIDQQTSLWTDDPKPADFSGGGAMLTVHPHIAGGVAAETTWIGQTAYVLIQQRRAASSSSGNLAILALNPQRRQASLAVPPLRPALAILGGPPAAAAQESQLLFIGGRPGDYTLYGTPPLGVREVPQPLFGEAEWLRQPARHFSLPASGRFVIYAINGEGYGRLMSAPLPPTASPRQLIREQGVIEAAQVSPTGAHVAYAVSPPGQASELKLLTLSSGRTTRIADGPIGLRTHAWRGDGQALAFERTEPEEAAPHTAIVEDITGSPRITPIGPGARPAWLPGANRLAFLAPADNGKTQLYIVGAQQDAPRTPLTQLPEGVIGAPSPSPSGQWIAIGVPDGRILFMEPSARS